MAKRTFNVGAFRLMAASALAAVALIVVSLPLLALQIDRTERARELQAVGASLAQTRDLLLERLGSGANWDQALLHMDAVFDPAWVTDLFTDPYDKDVGSRLFAVFDPQGRVKLAAEHAKPVAPARAEAFRQAAAGLLARMRVAETLRHATSHAGPRTNADWVLGTASVWIQGRPYFLHASLVGGDTGTVRQVHPQTPILMFATDLNAQMLPGLRERMLLGGASFVRPGRHPDPAFVDLPDEAGQPSVRLSWSPERPGTHLLALAALPLLTGLAALLGTVAVTYRQGVAATRELIAGEARAQYLATHDTLTGLGNRAFFRDRMARILADRSGRDRPFAVLLMDLDRFKAINDTRGHQCGDDLLVEVARRLAQACGREELCVRLGGDEFVILAPGHDEAEACRLASLVLAQFALPFRLSGTEVRTSVSIGISIGRAGTDPGVAGNLLRQADVALYKSKEEGRGTYRLFDPAMDERVRLLAELEGDLRHALAQGDIAVVYQPQVDGDRLVGVEALARWTHPQRGAISPGVFIRLAEECGLIELLGAQVLRRAFADSHAWPGLKVSVNVSATQLRLPGFLALLADAVALERVDPRRFDLEITEGLLLVNDTVTQATLAGIKSMGFGLALDDFGTGYSSLGYLRRFPIDTIKIDQSFTAALTPGSETERVVRAILALADAMDLAVVAEGVETEEQRRCLAAMGCRVMQGYLTGRPMPAARIDAWVGQLQALAS